MTTLHTFGCSVTQGFALPDTIRPITDPTTGLPLTALQIRQQGLVIDWNHIHVNQPSQWAWPQQLANQLGVNVVNNARRGACFQQIARQCAVAAANIGPQDTVIVMWTYIGRLSLQWPARTAVPFCNVVDPVAYGWHTVRLGMNKLFGLSPAANTTQAAEQKIQKYIDQATCETYLHPMGMYNSLYNHMVLQVMTDGFLRATGARVIHVSVEPESAVSQLQQAVTQLDPSLQAPYVIPDPAVWYHLAVDHHSCQVILDPSIAPAENDMHPSVTHHANFAAHLHTEYFAA